MSIDERPQPPMTEEFPPGPSGEGSREARSSTVHAEPVRAGERVASVDVIRGVALLGILAMNIAGFAWPWDVYEIPTCDPDASKLDIVLWGLNHIVFDTKMMTLFSMLFGAGLVLMSDRADGRGASIRGIYYRRVAWLLVIGLIHSYLIWDGDVLVLYACCGFLLYPLRRLSPRTLIVTGIALNLLLVPILTFTRLVAVPYMKEASARAKAEVKAGRTPGWLDAKAGEAWEEMKKVDSPRREDFLQDVLAYRAGYFEIVKHRSGGLVWEQTFGFLFGGLWFAGGRMLIGMGLMKLGVFSASRSNRTYAWMAAVGYGVGVPLMVFDATYQARHDFFLGHRLEHALAGWPLLTVYGSFPVVFGHIGVTMLACRAGVLPWLTRRLAAVGRMALSNYLFDSIACTTLFYGYGFDLFGVIHRTLLYAIVLSIWVTQLLVSPLWLEHFRFGPAEWLWRSLTYGQLQPLRRRPNPSPPLPE